MKHQHAPELQTTGKTAGPIIVDTERFHDLLNEINQSIAGRAYELFEGRSRQDGHDLDDWLRAESELLSAIPFKLAEHSNQLELSFQAGDLGGEKLEIGVEPQRVLISGQKQTDKTKLEPTGTGHRFHVVPLPAEVDPARSSVKLRTGAVELTLPKAVRRARSSAA